MSVGLRYGLNVDTIASYERFVLELFAGGCVHNMACGVVLPEDVGQSSDMAVNYPGLPVQESNRLWLVCDRVLADRAARSGHPRDLRTFDALSMIKTGTAARPARRL